MESNNSSTKMTKENWKILEENSKVNGVVIDGPYDIYSPELDKTYMEDPNVNYTSIRQPFPLSKLGSRNIKKEF